MNVEKNAAWAEKNHLACPILDDHLGKVGKLYGAKTTPHMFIIDKEGVIVYQGALDDNRTPAPKDDSVNYVAQALDNVLAGKPVEISQTKSYGCSVKYPPEQK
jgi:peroxiredoxin